MADEFDYREAFDEQKPNSLAMTSFELTEVTKDFGATREGWRAFLSQPAVKREIDEDIEELRKASLHQLIADAGNSNSVGKSQLIGQLINYGKQATSDGGPKVVFCHIPLTSEEAYSPHVGRIEGYRNPRFKK